MCGKTCKEQILSSLTRDQVETKRVNNMVNFISMSHFCELILISMNQTWSHN